MSFKEQKRERYLSDEIQPSDESLCDGCGLLCDDGIPISAGDGEFRILCGDCFKQVWE